MATEDHPPLLDFSARHWDLAIPPFFILTSSIYLMKWSSFSLWQFLFTMYANWIHSLLKFARSNDCSLNYLLKKLCTSALYHSSFLFPLLRGWAIHKSVFYVYAILYKEYLCSFFSLKSQLTFFSLYLFSLQ